MIYRCFLVVVLIGMLGQQWACKPVPPSQQASDTSVEASEEWVVFGSGRSGNGDIYATQPSTGETILIIDSSEPEGAVRYDAARNRLVYHRYEEDPPRAVLVSNGEDLFEDPNGDVAPAWSATGEWIAYAASRDGQEDLFIARPDGTEEQRLTTDAFGDRYPAWSPDGTRLVFARRLETGWDLHTLDPFSNPPTLERLTDDGQYVGHPAWSPNGLYIAFDVFFGEQTEIAVLDLATGAITRLTDRAGNDLTPAWSSDSRRVAFGGELDKAGNWDVFMVDVQTLQIQQLTTEPSFDGGPIFVPPSAIGR